MKGNGTFFFLSLMLTSFKVWNAIHTLLSSKYYLHPHSVPKFHTYIPTFALGCLMYILSVQSPKPKLLSSLQNLLPLPFFLISVNDKSIFLTQYKTWSHDYLALTLHNLHLQILLLLLSENIRSWPHLVSPPLLPHGLSHHYVLSAFVLSNFIHYILKPSP